MQVILHALLFYDCQCELSLLISITVVEVCDATGAS